MAEANKVTVQCQDQTITVEGDKEFILDMLRLFGYLEEAEKDLTSPSPTYVPPRPRLSD